MDDIEDDIARIATKHAERAAAWEAFDEIVEKHQLGKIPPAFIQEVTVGGLWSVQYLVPPDEPVPAFSEAHRLNNNPPTSVNYEAYYNGWPGDHRGWMRFQTKEEARDFYKSITGKMSREDYKACPWPRPFVYNRIDLDDNGDFVTTEPD